MIRINYSDIEPISDRLAKIKLKTISGDEFNVIFTTKEDLKNFPSEVTIDQISSITRQKLSKIM